MTTKYTSRPINTEAASALQKAGLHPVIAKLLAARGVSQAEEMNSSMMKLLKPTDLKGAKLAGELIAKAIVDGKKLNVVADYDCDGASACAVMVRGLKMLGAKEGTVSYLVPDRQKDGYGLTPPIVDRVIESFHPDVLITVDNGIASFDGVKRGIELGLQVIVTDHHLPALIDGEIKIPDATVIVNACQPGCTFESKALCGAGAAFYTVLMIRSALREMKVFTAQTQPRVDSLLQLVALATVADVVKLDENNRRLISNGLERIRAPDGYPGIRAIFEVAGRNADKATSTDLGFTIGPRINAAGRMSDMTIGIETLLTDDPAVAKELATKLHEINKERRSVEAGMLADAQQMVNKYLDMGVDNAIVVYDELFHEGIVGIVAGKIKEVQNRPTFVFAKAHSGDLKGSGRSIPGFHLRDALDLITKRHPNLILRFGGHSMAAGCTIAPDGLDAFRAALNTIAEDWLTPDMLQSVCMTDGSLARPDYTVDTVKALGEFVWGQGFEAPVFVDSARVIEQRLVGEKHLKLSLTVNGQKREGIWFFRTEFLPTDCNIDVAYTVGINEWMGRESVQILVNGLL